MLELQLGTNRDARRHRTMQVIRELQDKGFAHINVLMPEQSTFVMSRDVCRELGNERYNHGVEVMGFDTMFCRLHTDCGERRDILDDGGRLLAMEQAVEEVQAKGLLKAFSGLSTRPEHLSTFLTAYGMFSLHGADKATVLDAASKTDNAKLRGKLEDLTAIFDAYERICAAGAKDPSEEFQTAVELMEKHQWAKNSAWVVDGFTDFPAQQLAIIRHLITYSPFVQVSLEAAGIDDEHPATQISARTAKQLAELAAGLNVECEVVRTGDSSSEHPALAYLQEHLCDYTTAESVEIEGAEKVVRLFVDPSPYRECQHIIGTILRATRKGYRYREASIVLCDYDRYAPILETVARRYNVPLYFGSRRDEIAKKPIMAAVFSALDSVARGMQKDDVLNYLKSGLSNLTTDEVDVLENYVRAWNIHGRGWEPGDEGWTMHPDGYGMEVQEADKAKLETINEYRVRGIGPLLQLRTAMAEGKTVKEHLEALYTFFEEIRFVEHLQDIVDALMANGNEQMAMEYSQVSEVLNNAMEQMYDVIGTSEKRGNEFTKLFRLLCSAYKIATIPATVDQVQVLDLQDARFICSRLRYIAGAEEGVFPPFVQGSNLFDPTEIQEMQELGVRLPGTVEDTTQRSLSDIHTVVAGAKKMLVLSYSSDPSSPSTPSHLLTRVQQFFPGIQATRGAGEAGIYEADLMSPEMAGRLAGRIANRRAYDNITISLCSVENDTLQKTAWRLMDKADWALNDLSAASVRGIYGERISLTATRMDTYSACRYHYFLKYGLKLKEQARGGINSPVFGRFAHAVLEQTIREVETVHGGFQRIEATDLEAIARKHIEAYTAEKLRGLDSQPERYIYLYKRNCREILGVLRDICAEFRVSDFHCSAYELKVGGEEADMPAISIPGAAMPGSFTGVLDRVDTCVVDGKPYFRVCDYKTGKTKSFDLTDILSGLSTQLLLYQGALRKGGYTLPGMDETGNPAGMLYIPAKAAMVATSTKVDEKKVESERQKMLVRRGMLLASKEVLNAMEHPGEGGKTKYLPIKYASDGTISGDVCSADQLNMLDEFARANLTTAVDDIARGTVTANPISRGAERTACTYCPMKAACHKDACGIKYRYLAKVKTDRFWHEVETRLGKV